MKISIISAINGLGYGMAGLHTVDELIKMGHDVALFPIGRSECHHRHAENIKKAIDNASRFEIHSPCIRLWHAHDMSMFVGHGLHIGFPIFELDSFTDNEKHHLESCDRLFVCSNWAKSVVDNATMIPEEHIYVVPLGVDAEVFYPELSSRKPTIFLNIGKWEVRKGHDVLINIFEHAFTPADNVELWMMCDNPFLGEGETEQWSKKYKSSSLWDKIRFIPRVPADTEVANIMRQADCGVFPSRGEGWNLDAIEMLSCGKRLIISNYSAHTEFCTSQNSHLIPIHETESAYDGKWFFKQGNWGKIDFEFIHAFARQMRFVHEDKSAGNLTINTKGVATAQHFSWKNTAQCIVKYLS